MNTIIVIIIVIFVILLAFLLFGGWFSRGEFTGGKQKFTIFTQEPWFTEMKNGKKTVEARVGDADKYKDLIGKKIKIKSGKDKLKAIVKDVRHYKDLNAYLKKEGWKKVAPHAKDEADAKEQYMGIKNKNNESVYADDKVHSKGGIVAIEIALD